MFDNRIITRLASGFQSQIKIPTDNDLNTLLDALLEKNEFDKTKFDDKTRNFIIKNFQASIRSLEGAVNRIKIL
ncbi:DnaA ATPase domain-containing protein [Mycoplasmopsis anatis]|uniref:DnaA ATPase domain-containing protein n=1 Tax=Mycoplasmopsis anatis TaxID=171279 RepID=UPI0013ED5CA4|nr:DnaA/Hda family protein [Mycoplasmopsis anatis]